MLRSEAPLRRKRISMRCGAPPMSLMSDKMRVVAWRSGNQLFRMQKNRECRGISAARRELGAAGGARVEYEKALTWPRKVCGQVRGRRHKPGRKPSQNEQAKFRPISARLASPNTAIPFSNHIRLLTMFLIFIFAVKHNGRACAFRDITARLCSRRRGHRGAKHGTIHKTNVRRAVTRRAYRVPRTRSCDYRKPDMPTKPGCGSWSINSR